MAVPAARRLPVFGSTVFGGAAAPGETAGADAVRPLIAAWTAL